MRVALTYDMEAPGQDTWLLFGQDMILRALYRESVQATFFVQGRWAQAVPETVRKTSDEGHLIGMHSWAHARWDHMTREGVEEDVAKGIAAVTKAAEIGLLRPYARAPFGAMSEDARQVLESHGMHHVPWNVDPGDWRPTAQAEEVVRFVVGQSALRETAVVLLHTWPRATALATAPIIRDLKEKGAEFVTVDVL